MKTKLFLLTLLVAFIFSSCAKKTDTPPDNTTTYDDSYTINGNGFTNTTYGISTVAQQSSSFDATSGVTRINISGTSGDSMLVEYEIEFSGKTTGSFTLDPASSNVFTITTTPVKNSNGLQIYSANKGAKLTVSTYGTSGGKVTGTFSGSFTNTGNNYAITNGTFSAAVQ